DELVEILGYAFKDAAARGEIARIDPRPVTVIGIGIAAKVYDGTTAAAITGTPEIGDHADDPGEPAVELSGLLASDGVSLSSTDAWASFADAHAGTGKAVTVGGYALQGGLVGNYELVQPVGLTGDIEARRLVVTGIGIAEKVYDGTTAAPIIGTPQLG